MKNTKPEVRFAGFTDDWEQRKLGEIADIIGGGTPSTSISDFWDGDINWYAPAEIGDQTFLSSSQRKITKRGFDKCSTNMLPEGTVLFTSRAGIGKTAILSEKGCTNQGFQSIVPHKDQLDSYFIFARTPELKIYGETMGAGSTFVEVSGKQIANMELMLPNSYEEQQRIGTFFRTLDSAITLHQRKCDALIKVKKSMLQKMFPKNGKSKPEVRFAGFTDDWEQRKFSDITYPAGKKNKDNLPLESYSVTNDNGFIPQSEQFENGGTMATADKSMYYIVSKNSFAYNPARINVGSIGYYQGFSDVIVSSLYEVFKTDSTVDDRFLWHWFETKTFQRMIERLQEGGVRLYFYYDKLCMGSILMPKIEEQRQISKLFDSLDSAITLHQREVEKLTKLKKALLSKMFI